MPRARVENKHYSLFCTLSKVLFKDTTQSIMYFYGTFLGIFVGIPDFLDQKGRRSEQILKNEIILSHECP